jgi:hypothetical protein
MTRKALQSKTAAANDLLQSQGKRNRLETTIYDRRVNIQRITPSDKAATIDKTTISHSMTLGNAEIWLNGFISSLQFTEKAPIADENYTIDSTWSVQDVLEQCKNDVVIVTPAEAREILDWIDKKHDATIGINWDVISTYIEMYLDERRRTSLDYDYIEISFDDTVYIGREIDDHDNVGEKLVIAPVELKDAIEKKFGGNIPPNPAGIAIDYYCTPEKMILDDYSLFDLKNS